MNNKYNNFEDNYFGRLDFLSKRIGDLTKEKRFFEIMLWFSVLFEAEITLLLSFYENNIKFIGDIQNSISKKFKCRSIRNIREERKTLGRLKEELSKHLDDKEILNSLVEFIELRNKTIHRFFDCNDNDLIFFERKIKFNIDKWWDLVYKLSEKMREILKENNELLKNESEKLKQRNTNLRKQ